MELFNTHKAAIDLLHGFWIFPQQGEVGVMSSLVWEPGLAKEIHHQTVTQ